MRNLIMLPLALLSFLLSTTVWAATIDVQLRDSDNNALVDGGTATLQYHDGSWKTATNDGNGNFSINTAAASVIYIMQYHNGSEQRVLSSAITAVTFNTVSTTISLKDSDGTPLVGGIFEYHQNGWSDTLTANTITELLPGSYMFLMYYNNASQKLTNISISGTDDEVAFVTTTTTVSLKDSDGNPLAGGIFDFHNNGWSDSLAPNTSEELLPGNYMFRMHYNNGTQLLSLVPISGVSQLVLFETTTTLLALEDCNGKPLNNGSVVFHQNGWSLPIAANSEVELLPGTYTFIMHLNNGVQRQSGVSIFDPSYKVLFVATEVTFTYPNPVTYHQDGWGTYTPGMFLLPGNYRFKFGSVEVPLNISGCSLDGVVAILNLKDHNGAPLPGGKARGGLGINNIQFHVSGATDSDGQLLYFGNGSTDMTFEMRFNGTTQTLVQDVSVNPVFDFQTAELRVRMETCSGDPVDGGTSRFKTGLYKYWLNNNVAGNSNTGDAGPGEAAGEVFPGTYDVDMQFRYGQNTNTVIVTPAGGMTTFKTTNVALNYTGGITYKKAGGTYSAHYIKPDMEFLPGDYEFMTSGASIALSVGDCNNPISKSLAVVKVMDCNGDIKPGVDIKWYKWGQAGNKHSAGTTAGSPMLILMDHNVLKAGVIAGYLGQSNTLIQTLANNSIFTFQMIDVELILNNHDNTGTLSPQWMQFYAWGKAGNKMPFDPSQHECLLPGSYGFVMSYNNTHSTMAPVNVGNVNPVVFQTGLVDDVDGCSFDPTTYYRYGAAGTTYPFIDPMEFMPGQIGVHSLTNPTQQILVAAGGYHPLMSCPKSVANTPDENNTNAIKLFPNPTSRTLTIVAEGTLHIFNNTGKLMYKGQAKTIDISTWAKGVYLVRTATQAEKLIIK